MNREMRRKTRAISAEEAREILSRESYGVLATVGSDNQPYGVPLSYVTVGDTIYVHCAQVGQKIDNIAYESRVAFTVVGDTKPVFINNNFSTFFESAIVFGRARKVEEDREKRRALLELCRKYLPDHMDVASAAIDRSWEITDVYAISMDQVTGKARRSRE